MKRLLFISLVALFSLGTFAIAADQSETLRDNDPIWTTEPPTRDFSQRIVFEKYIWAEGVDPKARYLNLLMVKFFDEDTVRLRNGQLTSLTGRDINSSKAFLSRHPEINPRIIIWNKSEEEYMANLARVEKKSGWDLVDLFSFYCFEMTSAPADAQSLINDILKCPEVETAYYEPIPVDMTCTDLGIVTPNFRPRQTYHDPAPVGVDLDWVLANNIDDVVNGPSTRWVGIFERGMQTGHEDIANPVVATSGTPDADNDHGTAVTGVLGACDANGVGCLGFLADEQMRLYQRNSSGYGSTADIYNLANGQLLAGEVTNSSWGYTANPLPPGQSCPCNPSQNGLVNPEYNAALKAEIQAGVADGIHYFLSAGNGCVNLDHVTFGNTFRNSTDTGSNYVSAIESAAGHDASCFTNWGERCDINAWGDGSFTLGYGDEGDPGWEETTQNEWYTQSFGGTSNAGPTVAGCAGVIHNIVRDFDASTITTSQMRDYLNDFGTAAGTTPGNIGVMPNLRGILAPEYNPDIRTGWSWYMVPRNVSGATGDDCLLTTDLNPDPATTYWSGAIENTARIMWGSPGRYRIYVDDVFEAGWADGDDTLYAQERTYGINAATTVRGGRHFARLTADPLLEVSEQNENNNDAYEQWAWDGRELTNGQVLTLSAPPIKFATDQEAQGFANENVDGYDGTQFQNSGWWDIMMVMAETSTADYDARVYSEDVTSTNGFDTHEASSAYVSFSDFVGVNNNNAGQAQELIAAVLNYDGETSDYRVECGTSSILASPGVGRNSYGSHTLTSTELFDVWEFNVNELVPYSIEVDVTSGNANVVISVFGPDDEFFGRSSSNIQANLGGEGDDEMIECWTPAEIGWHAIVVHKHNYADWDQTADFDLYVGKSGFDLTYNLNTDWSHTLVVRQSIGTVPAVLPATLTGNIATNYVNAGYINQGCGNTISGLNDQFYKDGPAVFTTGSWGGPYTPGFTTQWLNQNIGTVTGGRHQIGDVIDIFNEGAEWDETNNRHDVQFVWTPAILTNNVMLTSVGTAPNWRDWDATIYFPDYNVDGYRFTGGGFWSGVGMMPNNNTDDVYNLYLYDPATSSTNGFGTRHVNSWTGGADVEWVLENGNNIASETFDVGVDNNTVWPNDTSQSTYRMQQSNRIQDLMPGNAYGQFAFPATEIINVFDCNLVSGVPTWIRLDNRGAGDLGFAIYNPSLLYGSRTTYTHLENTNGDGSDEAFQFTPTETGRHGLVVFKNDRSDLNANPYGLSIGDRTPRAPDSLVIMWTQSDPDLILELTWAPVTQDVSGNPIVVDRYDIYFTYNLDAVYPIGWSYGGSTLDNTQLPIYPDDSQFGFQCLFVAVDVDGFIVGESPLPDAISSFIGRKAADVQLEVGTSDNILIPRADRGDNQK